MAALFTAFCYVCGFLALLIGVCLASVCAFESFWMLVDRLQSQGATRAKEDFANQIAIDSWWFRESKEASEIMKVYGNSYLDGSRDVSAIREKWREAISGEKKNG